MSKAVLGIIGGSGVYDLPGLEKVRERKIDSPWGEPSAPLRVGEIAGLPVVFLSRHDKGHRLSPSDIDYRANIDVLKPWQVVDARAADHAEHRLGHDGFPYASKIASALDSASSCPAKAGHPVNITVAVLSWTSVITGSPAFAGDDERWVYVKNAPNAPRPTPSSW